MDNVLRRELHKIWTKFSDLSKDFELPAISHKRKCHVDRILIVTLGALLFGLLLDIFIFTVKWQLSSRRIIHKTQGCDSLYIIVIIFLCNLDMLYIGKQSLCDLSLTEETVVIIFVSLSFLKQMT